MGTLPNSFLSKTEKQDYKNRKGPTHTCCLIQHFANLPSSLINQVLHTLIYRETSIPGLQLIAPNCWVSFSHFQPTWLKTVLLLKHMHNCL